MLFSTIVVTGYLHVNVNLTVETFDDLLTYIYANSNESWLSKQSIHHPNMYKVTFL